MTYSFSISFNKCIAVLLMAMLVLSSCSNPVTPETKVTVTDPPQPQNIPFAQASVESTQGEDYIVNPAERRTMNFSDSAATKPDLFRCVIDTSGIIPKLTLRAVLVPSNKSISRKLYIVQQAMLSIDSLPIDGKKPALLNGGQLRFIILTKNNTLDTLRVPHVLPQSIAILDQNKATSERELRLTLTAKIKAADQVASLQGTFRIRY